MCAYLTNTTPQRKHNRKGVKSESLRAGGKEFPFATFLPYTRIANETTCPNADTEARVALPNAVMEPNSLGTRDERPAHGRRTNSHHERRHVATDSRLRAREHRLSNSAPEMTANKLASGEAADLATAQRNQSGRKQRVHSLVGTASWSSACAGCSS